MQHIHTDFHSCDVVNTRLAVWIICSVNTVWTSFLQVLVDDLVAGGNINRLAILD